MHLPETSSLIIPSTNSDDLELHDFIDEANFDQYMNLIPAGENEYQITPSFDSELINGLPVDFVLIITFPCVEEDQMKEVEEDDDGEEDSSGTTITTTTTRKKKADRSRTLISERRRRGRMKEKLYALRSLVPNITKV